MHKREYLKVEHFEDKTFIIIAAPIVIEGKDMAIEFVKETTKNLLLSDHSSNVNLTMSDYLRHMTNLSSKDVFSGLFNKNYMHQIIAASLADKKEIQVAFMDINNFKEVNDTYGHLSGDQVIVYLASLLLSSSKENDFVCGRVGGDEFLIVYEHQDSLEDIVNEILLKVEAHPFEHEGKVFHVSIATGYEKNIPGDNENSILERVDKKMYEIKRK